MSKSIKQLLSYILVLSVLFGVVPLISPEGKVYAATSSIVTCSSGSSSSGAMGLGNWTWDGSSQTLTIENISYSSILSTENNTRVFYIQQNSTIVAIGTNEIDISNTSNGSLYGFYCVGNVTITGSGVIKINIESKSNATCIYQTAAHASDVISVNCAVSMRAISTGSSPEVCALKSYGGTISINSSLTSSGGIITSNVVTFASIGAPFVLSQPSPIVPSPVSFVDYYWPEYFFFTPKSTGGSIEINLYKRFNEVGRTVKFGIKTEEGYELSEIIARTESGKSIPVKITSESTAELIMPNGDVYVTPVFRKITF